MPASSARCSPGSTTTKWGRGGPGAPRGSDRSRRHGFGVPARLLVRRQGGLPRGGPPPLLQAVPPQSMLPPPPPARRTAPAPAELAPMQPQAPAAPLRPRRWRHLRPAEPRPSQSPLPCSGSTGGVARHRWALEVAAPSGPSGAEWWEADSIQPGSRPVRATDSGAVRRDPCITLDDDVVVIGEEFTVTLGLAAMPAPGVASPGAIAVEVEKVPDRRPRGRARRRPRVAQGAPRSAGLSAERARPERLPRARRTPAGAVHPGPRPGPPDLGAVPAGGRVCRVRVPDGPGRRERRGAQTLRPSAADQGERARPRAAGR